MLDIPQQNPLKYGFSGIEVCDTREFDYVCNIRILVFVTLMRTKKYVTCRYVTTDTDPIQLI